MGILVSGWNFDDHPPPSLDQVARELERRIGVHVLISGQETREQRRLRLDPEGRFRSDVDGPVSFGTLRVPAVSASYEFELGRTDRGFQVEAPLSPHLYLWLHLDAAMRALGGRRVVARVSYFPPDNQVQLLRPWHELDWWTRCRFRGPWFLRPK